MKSEDSGIEQDCGIHKRQSYLSWEDYFMAIAFLSAQRSKDPNSQVSKCVLTSLAMYNMCYLA